jgi:hypothetical protein
MTSIPAPRAAILHTVAVPRQAMPLADTAAAATLFVLGLLLPLQDHIPAVRGFSAVTIVFAVIVAGALASRPLVTMRTAVSPVFVASFGLVAAGFIMERFHGNSDYGDVFRLAQAIVGGVAIGAFVRSKRCASALVKGLTAGATLVAVLMLTRGYSKVAAADAQDFREAAATRVEALGSIGLRANANELAFICAVGAVLSLAYALKSSSKIERIVAPVVAVICGTGMLVPMSRGGIVIAVAGGVFVMLASGVRKRILAVIALAVFAWIALAIPTAVYSRLQVSTELSAGGKMESRPRLFLSAVGAFPEYALEGVGAGNYWQFWAVENGLANNGQPVGAHNTFFQVTMYWGAAAFFFLVLILWRSARALRGAPRDALGMAVKALGVMLALRVLVTHNFYAKEFSIGLGLISAYPLWRAVSLHRLRALRAARRATELLPAVPRRLTNV